MPKMAYIIIIKDGPKHYVRTIISQEMGGCFFLKSANKKPPKNTLATTHKTPTIYVQTFSFKKFKLFLWIYV